MKKDNDLVIKIRKFLNSLSKIEPLNLDAKVSLPQIKDVSAIKPKKVKVAKMPGIAATSKKNPTKVAEQLKNPHQKKLVIDQIKVSKPKGALLKNNAVRQNSAVTEPMQPVTDKLNLDHAGNVVSNPSKIQFDKDGHIVPLPVHDNSTVKINASQHGFKNNYHTDLQNKLIDGINFKRNVPVIGDGANSEQGATFWAHNDNHSTPLLTKNSMFHPNRETVYRDHKTDGLNSARREVLFYNMSRDFFGLHKHVPITAGFGVDGQEFSAQKKVKDASHIKYVQHQGDTVKIDNPNHEKFLKDAYNDGTIHKLALMDNIMGHHDRHKGNYLLNDDGSNINLIDNGTAFDYKNFDKRTQSHFHQWSVDPTILNMQNGESDIHPKAKEWLKSLRPNDAIELFKKHGYEYNNNHVRGFIKRLNFLQKNVDNLDSIKQSKHLYNKDDPEYDTYSPVEKLLHASRMQTGKIIT